MHRFILGLRGKVITDHKDTNRLNNCRDNIRRATRAQNAMNRSTYREQYKGVYRTPYGRFHAVVKSNRYLGTFDTPEEAARAYNEAATQLFGEFARLNEIPALTPGQ